MSKIAFVARGLSKNGVRSFIETELDKENKKANSNYLLFTDEKEYKDKYKNLKTVYIKPRNKIIWDYIVLLFYLKKHKIDEAIYTKNIVPFTHVLGAWKKTVYVLDLAFKYPDLKAYKKLDSLYMSLLLGLSLRIADEIWAISKFTKDEVLKFFSFVDDKKIMVKHLPINNVFKKITNKKEINRVRTKYGLNNKFIFYCGSISPRKNILNLLKAFDSIKNKIPHNLYLVSSRIWNSDDVLAYLDQNLKDRVRIIKGVTDAELAVLYSIADLFVYPSLYEGYGLPIKEAEACECRFLTSDFGAMREIVEGKTSVTNSKNVESLKKDILRLIR